MSFGAVHLAFHPCSKLQGIQAKANKTLTVAHLGKISCKIKLMNKIYFDKHRLVMIYNYI